MINRAGRRQLNKDLRKKMTDEQYERFVALSVKDMVDLEVKKIWDKLIDDIIRAMKENRISEDRIERIVKRTLELAKERDVNEKRVP